MKNPSLQSYYDKKIASYSTSNKRSENILELIGYIKGKKVLDIGCSTGLFGQKLRSMGNQVYGVDISKKAINKAKKVLDEAFIVDLLSDMLPFDKEDFDVIVCSEVIEHLFDNSNLFKETKRVLKKEGIMIITTPNIVYWGHRLSILKGKFDYQKEGPFDEGHVRFYTYSSLLNQFKKAGFNILTSNHVYLGATILKPIKDKFPSLFAYQFVFKILKK